LVSPWHGEQGIDGFGAVLLDRQLRDFRYRFDAVSGPMDVDLDGTAVKRFTFDAGAGQVGTIEVEHYPIPPETSVPNVTAALNAAGPVTLDFELAGDVWTQREGSAPVFTWSYGSTDYELAFIGTTLEAGTLRIKYDTASHLQGVHVTQLGEGDSVSGKVGNKSPGTLVEGGGFPGANGEYYGIYTCDDDWVALDAECIASIPPEHQHVVVPCDTLCE